MHSEIGSVGAREPPCSHLSGTFPGPCFDDYLCELTCLHESVDNIMGACSDWAEKCYCVTRCPPPAS